MKLKIIALVAAVLVVGVSGVAFAVYAWNRHTKVPATSMDITEPSVEVIGAVNGLMPGKQKPLSVAIDNKNEFAVRVTDLSGGSAATKSGCNAYAVRVVPIDKSDPVLLIPARSRRTIPIQIEMQDWADTKCGGQTFEIDLNSSIVPA